jgi:hypothetical protein
MAGQIKRPLGSITLVTTLLASFLGVTVLANTAHAGDCIAAPNSQSPPGKHWYYRLDWATKRKCWYVGPLGRSVQEAAPATKGRAAHLHSMPARPNQQLQADDPPLSPGEVGPPSLPVKVIAVKPNAASVGATEDDATSSIPEISAPQVSTTSSETVAKGTPPASSDAPVGSAATDDTALSTPEASAPQAKAFSEISPRAGARESTAVSTASQVGGVSDDVEPTVRVGELTANARLPMTLFVYLALGLAVVGILSFAFRKLFKNETNKMVAGADVTEIAGAMALRLGRGRDSNGESGDLQQADAFVLNEVGCARDIEEPDEGTAPTPISHDQLPRAKLTFNEYRQRVDACLNWAQEARAERVVCLTLAEAWLRAALADLADSERNNKSEQGLGSLT